MKLHTIYAYTWSCDTKTFFYVGKTTRDPNMRSTRGAYKKAAMGCWIELMGWSTQDLRDHRVILETNVPGSHESLWLNKLQTLHPDWVPVNKKWSACVSDTPEESKAHQRELAIANVKRHYSSNESFRQKIREQSSANYKLYNDYCMEKFGHSYAYARRKYSYSIKKDDAFIVWKNGKIQNN